MKLVIRLLFLLAGFYLLPFLNTAITALTTLVPITAMHFFMGASILTALTTAVKFKRPFLALAIAGGTTLLAYGPTLLASLKGIAVPALAFAVANPLALVIGTVCLILFIMTPPPSRTPQEQRIADDAATLVRNLQNQPHILHPNFIQRMYLPGGLRAMGASPTQQAAPPVVIAETIGQFQKRLDEIGYTEDLNEEFYDPISMNLMDNPINAITEIKKPDNSVQIVDYIIDTTTYLALKMHDCDKREQPANRLPILRWEPCTELRATIDCIITELEKEHHSTLAAQEALQNKQPLSPMRP